MNRVFGKPCFVLPDMGSREPEFAFAISRLDTLAVGHLEGMTVRKSLVAAPIVPTEPNHSQRRLEMGRIR